jgi:hypothetical protein
MFNVLLGALRPEYRSTSSSKAKVHLDNHRNGSLRTPSTITPEYYIAVPVSGPFRLYCKFSVFCL